MRLLVAILAAATLAAVGLLLVVSSGGGAADFPVQSLPEGRPLPQGDVFRSPTTEPPTINPFTTRDQVAARYVLPFTHDALVELDPETGAIRAAAAESWSVSEDGASVTYRLRKDLRFADGSPVTRQDLEFTLRTARDPRLAARSQMAFALSDLASAEVLDERTIRLTAAERRTEPALALGADVRPTQRRFFVAATGEEPDSDAFFAKLADVVRCGPGTGPYAEQDVVLGTPGWIPGSHLNLVQNPHSWRRAVYPEAWNLAGLQLRFVVEEAAHRPGRLVPVPVGRRCRGDARGRPRAREAVRAAPLRPAPPRPLLRGLELPAPTPRRRPRATRARAAVRSPDDRAGGVRRTRHPR